MKKLLMSSNVLYAPLLVANSLCRITTTQLFYETLSHFIHLPREVHGSNTFKYRIVNVHWLLATKRWSDIDMKKKYKI